MKEDGIFKIELTKEQRNFISSLLPRGMSLQPITPPTIKSVGRPSNKHRREAENEEISKTVNNLEQKRRRGRPADDIESSDKKLTVGKKQEINRCWEITKKLKKHQSSWPFRNPINIKQFSIPDYFKVVLNPIDLHSIENNFKYGSYKHPSEFQRDINQMFLNSYKFNPKDDPFFTLTVDLEEYYNQLVKEMPDAELKGNPERHRRKEEHGHRHYDEKNSELGEIQKEIITVLKKSLEFVTPKYERHKTNYFTGRGEAPMNIQEKRELGNEIRQLPPKHLERVAEIIMKNKPNHNTHHHNNQNGQVAEEVETFGVELEKLDLKTLREIQKYIKQTKNKFQFSLRDDYESRDFTAQLE